MKKEITIKDKISQTNNLLIVVQSKISELKKIQKDLLRELELLRKELELDKLYD